MGRNGDRRNAMEVKQQLSKIGQELEIMINKGTIDDAEQFLEEQSKLLHPNHYHMTTCKHNLMQMYGRTEGYLIQDMDEEQLARKKELCLEHLEVLKAIDPDRSGSTSTLLPHTSSFTSPCYRWRSVLGRLARWPQRSSGRL